MDDELKKLRKKKYEELMKKYMDGDKKMEENMPNTPLTITDADIEQIIKKYDMMVVDCWAPWCGPCKVVGPIIDELAKEMQGQVVFGKLNVDENEQTSMKYQIMAIPTLLVFKNGELIEKMIGAHPKDELKQMLETYEE